MTKVNIIYQENLGWIIIKTSSMMYLDVNHQWYYPSNGWTYTVKKFESFFEAEVFCNEEDLEVVNRK